MEALYVLVTPARNEAGYIRKTIESVVSQTRRPMRWIIVSDGSTDGTDQIVNEYSAKHQYIRLLRIDGDTERNFGSKVRAIRAGVGLLESLPYEFTGILDADISFGPTYYESVLRRFQENSRLGLCGGTL